MVINAKLAVHSRKEESRSFIRPSLSTTFYLLFANEHFID